MHITRLKTLRLSLVALSLGLSLSYCSDKTGSDSTSVVTPPKDIAPQDNQQKLSVAQQQKDTANLIKEHHLYRYPTLTTLLAVKNAEKTIGAVEDAGGRVDYNPNLGRGSEIGFLIVSLPPEKLLDEDFIESLDLRAMSVSHPKISSYKLMANTPKRAFENSVYVPIDDIKIPQLQKDSNNDKLLGEGVTIAVIDTGIDASHPAFGERVIYWNDQTEETQVALKKAELDKDGKVLVQLDGKDAAVELPKTIKSKTGLMVGTISEAALAAQVSFDQKLNDKKVGLDINNNGLVDDEFLIVLERTADKGEVAGNYYAYVDVDGNGEFTGTLESAGIVDFNEKRAAKNPVLAQNPEFVQFPARNQSIKYPLILVKNDKGEVDAIRLGVSDGSHGTHVAGIAAGNGANVLGAAPLAKLMSLKVCSGISCTTDAILRGIIDAFYNDYSKNPELVPDVVNISLGSHQKYSQDIFDYLLRDITAKFGTVFVVSASNSGPGHRSLNSIAAFGPTIQVGAHVSENSLKSHYLLDPAVEVANHNLLFFSSVGPSYTGHLRPNVIAPGSALSATALTDTGLQMYNGTSMSSPIVAGSVAALLSVAKKDPNYRNTVLKTQREKIQSVRDEADGKEGSLKEVSLGGLAMAVRAALENTSNHLPQYTTVQQGHGLIDTQKAYSKLLEYSTNWANQETQYFEVQINGNLKGGALYSRDTKISNSNAAKISLEEDGEMSELEKLRIQSTPLQVKLEYVEVQDTDGSVDLLKNNMPFSVATRGVEDQNANEATIIMTNRRSDFVSLRKLEQMQAGKTYVAHYSLSQNGIRVQSIVDVVHMPIELSTIAKNMDLPALSTDRITARNAFAKKDVNIGANVFHRYLVAVDSQDTELVVSAGILKGNSGALIVTAYDPDGKELEYKVTGNSNEVDMGASSKTTITVDTRSKPGIYEITLATSASSWMAPTTYDLLIRTRRVETSNGKAIIKIASGESKSFGVLHPMNDGEDLEISGLSLKPVENLELKVVPSRWTFHKINIPEGTESLQVEAYDNEDTSFFGAFVPYLFKSVEGDSPEVLVKAEDSSKNLSLNIKSDSFPTTAYIAVETYGVVRENGGLKDASTKLPVRVSYTVGGDKASLKASVSSGVSSKKNTLVELTAPDVSSTSYTELSVEINGSTVKVPVLVSPKKK